MVDDFLWERIRQAIPHLPKNDACELMLVIRRLVAALAPEQVYVFGSQVRGEASHDSDIDILIVVPTADRPAHRLDQAAYQAAAPHSLDLDILVMAREEFTRRSKASASLPATVLREGRVLYAA